MTGSTWNYDDDDCECGPRNWPGEPKGNKQSPIDLQISKMKTVGLNDPLKFVNYDKPISGQLVNTGHSVQFTPEARINAPEIYGGMLDQSYRFIQYHFHWAQKDNEGSEHTLGGLRYPAELHLVHQGVDDPTKLAVLGVFLKLDDIGSALSVDEAALSKIKENGQSTSIKDQVLNVKLPDNCGSFARYEGSLTTPPCSENVIWTVFTDPLGITTKQIALLRSVKDYRGSVIHKNYRPVQNLNDRKIYLTC
jgi:carbonic anhydrase